MDSNSKSIGCFIDLDGVVWNGGVPFNNAKMALNILNQHKIPYVFVTNGTCSPIKIAEKLNSTLQLNVTHEQVVAAQSPCVNLKHYHTKHVLLCCQDDALDIVPELGFKSYITIQELIDIFPDLDYVDHQRRKLVHNEEELNEKQKNFKPIECILLLGEPIRWESALQVVIDILMTNGDPRADRNSTRVPSTIPYPHIPIIACNRDLTFKGAAPLPRFGHGAFLECLEHLYERITKHELIYKVLIGKPYMSTYKFATIALEKLNGNKPLDRIFIIGDNPDVDIKGANLFDFYIKSKRIKDKRQIYIESILVCTGVYNPTKKFNEELEQSEIEKFTQIIDELDEKSLKNLLSHNNTSNSYGVLNKPNHILNDILDAANHIIKSQ